MAANANAIKAGHAFVEYSVEDSAFRRGLARIESRCQKVGGALQRIGGIGAAIGGAVSAPFIGAIKMASDAQETMSKFEVVFGDQAGAIKAWGDNLAGAVGRSKTEVAGMLASFQDLLVPMGMTSTEATGMSQTLSQLAIDLGSFNNMSDADVARDLAAALTGSGEVMKKYGVIVSEAAVKQELLNQGMDPKVATEAEKAQARLNIILAGTTAAQGDAARTADGFANRLKALQAKVTDTAIEIGTALLPMATELIGRMNEAVVWVAQWISENTALVEVMGIAGISLAAMGTGIYAVGTAFNVLGTAVGMAGTALTFISAHPVLAAAAVIATTIGWLVSEFYKANDAVTSFDEALKGLDGKRTFGDPDDVQALIQRYDQLAAKTKLTAEEQREAHQVMHGLRMEFGDLSIGQKDGRLTNVDKVKAQIQAARQGKSIGLQKQSIGQAEAAMATRKAEGADGAELAGRAKAIADMNAELERTQRIVKDASPTAGAAPTALPASVLSAREELAVARAAMTPTVGRAADAASSGMAAANRQLTAAAPMSADALGGTGTRNINRLIELENKVIEKLSSIDRSLRGELRIGMRVH